MAALGDGGDGSTAACCCTRAERGEIALRTADVIGPSLGSGAPSRALRGRCPIGLRLDVEGKSGVAADSAGGWAAAAAPVQGSAVAGAATPTETQSPITAADAIDIDAIRRRGGMTHLSRKLTDVTLVISGICVASDVRIGMHL